MAGDVPEDGDGEKDMFSMLEHDEEAEEEKKKKLEEDEEEAKDEPSREIIRDNEVSLHGKSSTSNYALKNVSFFTPSCYSCGSMYFSISGWHWFCLGDRMDCSIS
jgi:hypothetical protein